MGVGAGKSDEGGRAHLHRILRGRAGETLPRKKAVLATHETKKNLRYCKKRLHDYACSTGSTPRKAQEKKESGGERCI